MFAPHNYGESLNSLPLEAVDCIEVLKDGASAVYGSDAIAGVVNIITRKSGEKTDLSLYTGTSGHGDGTTFDLNLTTGTGTERDATTFAPLPTGPAPLVIDIPQQTNKEISGTGRRRSEGLML